MDLETNGILNIGSYAPVVIKKLYGPTIFCDIRITASAHDCTWVIEREVCNKDGTYHWETMVEFDGQESLRLDKQEGEA